MRKRWAEDLSGRTFGCWTVLSRAENSTTNKLPRWNCICECGTESIVYGQNLKRWGTKSGSSNCGCKRRLAMQGNTIALRHGKVSTQEYKLWANAWERAKKRNLDFDISIDDVIIPDVCPLLGIPLFKGTNKSKANSPSIDRIDPDKGYTKDNIWVVSNRANTLKNDASLQELELLVRNLKGEMVQR